MFTYHYHDFQLEIKFILFGALEIMYISHLYFILKGTSMEEKMCQFRRDDGILVQFTYTYADSGYLIKLPKRVEKGMQSFKFCCKKET